MEAIVRAKSRLAANQVACLLFGSWGLWFRLHWQHYWFKCGWAALGPASLLRGDSEHLARDRADSRVSRGGCEHPWPSTSDRCHQRPVLWVLESHRLHL